MRKEAGEFRAEVGGGFAEVGARFAEVRREIVGVCSDLTYVALAVGAHRPQATEG